MTASAIGNIVPVIESGPIYDQRTQQPDCARSGLSTRLQRLIGRDVAALLCTFQPGSTLGAAPGNIKGQADT
jgi:hypothetical protein